MEQSASMEPLDQSRSRKSPWINGVLLSRSMERGCAHEVDLGRVENRKLMLENDENDGGKSQRGSEREGIGRL